MKTICLSIGILIAISTVHAQIIIPFAGGGTSGLGDYGPATAAQMGQLYNVAVDDSGNVYISDDYRVRQVNSAGIITTFCGTGAPGYTGGFGSQAFFATIGGYVDFAFDRHGNVFIADASNHCIRKIDLAGNIYTTVGTGIAGYNGDNIPAISAQLYSPSGIVFDKKGNLLIYDEGNYRIRKVDTFGTITTIAGTGVQGYSPDGCNADTVMLSGGCNIKVDKNGKLFFGDNGYIRCIDTFGMLSTIAGNGVSATGGEGVPATSTGIDGCTIAIDTTGAIYIAEQNDNKVRKVDNLGIIRTIAGNGMPGTSGDWSDPLAAHLSSPGGIDVDGHGNIFIGSVLSGRVRKITTDTPTAVNSALKLQETLEIFPNPCNGHFVARLSSSTDKFFSMTLYNIYGVALETFAVLTNKNNKIIATVPSGTYYLRAVLDDKNYTKKLVIQ
ncbi:hypothetical protein CJD36_011030 [Flavipsychrobacter stenotrophus]|uniref:Secretion system C-terminal sorting domain-containing protein n=1 Tax=Flavipsychrobacter stenotrophus TaxID=2077091 RepID=A0A2S7SUA3_9BACT|nr:T9SS type A sorting domain-containing protein [Flavipsychrobacter stenotrophus]PQJ10502.1 hypothetical protein CJD36_011030 [Flavipsychrobacter stenotrophus]